MSSEVIEKKINYDIDSMFKSKKDVITTKKIKCLLWGSPGSGKTYSALTFPGPIYFIDTDDGVALNLKYVPDDKDVEIVDIVELSTGGVTTDSGKAIDNRLDEHALMSLEKFELAVTKLTAMNLTEGTIVIDTITDVWAWIGTWLKLNTEKLMSKGGNEYMSRFAWGDANNRYDWMMKELKKIKCNLVIIGRVKDVYDGSGNITAQKKPDAQKKTESYVDVVIELKRLPTKQADGKMKSIRKSYISKSRGADPIDPTIIDLTYDKLKTLLDEVH